MHHSRENNSLWPSSSLSHKGSLVDHIIICSTDKVKMVLSYFSALNRFSYLRVRGINKQKINKILYCEGAKRARKSFGKVFQSKELRGMKDENKEQKQIWYFTPKLAGKFFCKVFESKKPWDRRKQNKKNNILYRAREAIEENFWDFI